LAISNTYVHVIWTTFQTLLPNDQKGNWELLAKTYLAYPESFNFLNGSLLCSSYQQVHKIDGLVFDTDVQKYLTSQTKILSEKDRIGSRLALQEVVCRSQHVELLISSGFIESKQALSRLKSRSATLLDFEYGLGGKNTWSKGFWVAEINTDTGLHHKILERFAD